MNNCPACNAEEGTFHSTNCSYFMFLGPKYTTKDSGARQEFSTGMVRDVQTDKPRYDLCDWVMITRWAELMARGAKKYGERNWEKAETQEELNRFLASALRHCVQYFQGDSSEDHGAAVMFNISGAEMVKRKLINAKFNEGNIPF